MEIIKIKRNGKDIVSARELHKALQSKRQFTEWFKAKVQIDPLFVEGKDWWPTESTTTPQGGRPKTDYYITPKTAKIIAVRASTPIGNQVASYLKTPQEEFTSLKMAEITGKLHRHIMRDIRDEIEKLGEIGETIFGLTYFFDVQGKKQPMFTMNRKGWLQMGARYDAKTRYTIISYAEKLEKQLTHKLPQSFAEALRMLADTTEEKERISRKLEEKKARLELQEHVIKESAPKVEYYEEVLTSSNAFTSTTIAKELGMSAVTMHRLLKQKHVIFRIDNHWVLSHLYQNEGYTKTRTYTFTDGEGRARSTITTVWTQKGREFIHKFFKNAKRHSNTAIAARA